MSLLTGKVSDFLKDWCCGCWARRFGDGANGAGGEARLVVARWVARADDALGSGVPGAVGDGRMVARSGCGYPCVGLSFYAVAGGYFALLCGAVQES